MTEYPRKGDRVKVTYEGVVTKADDKLHRFIEIEGGLTMPNLGSAKVEVTKRKFAVGTTVRTSGGSHAFRTVAGWWWGGGFSCSADDETVQHWLEDGSEVVYEPSA